jgi:hypothetical protein
MPVLSEQSCCLVADARPARWSGFEDSRKSGGIAGRSSENPRTRAPRERFSPGASHILPQPHGRAPRLARRQRVLRNIWVQKVIKKVLGRGRAAAGLWREKPAHRRRLHHADDHDRQTEAPCVIIGERLAEILKTRCFPPRGVIHSGVSRFPPEEKLPCPGLQR